MRGAIFSWIADVFTADDAAALSDTLGKSSYQHMAEAMSALIAMREWKHVWKDRRLRLAIRENDVAMLTLFVKMRPPPAGSHGLGVGVGRGRLHL